MLTDRFKSAVKQVSGSLSARTSSSSSDAIKRAQAVKKLSEYRASLSELHISAVTAFLEAAAAGTDPDLFPRPGAAKASQGALPTVRRLAPIALVAVEMTSYAKVARAAKYAIKCMLPRM